MANRAVAAVTLAKQIMEVALALAQFLAQEAMEVASRAVATVAVTTEVVKTTTRMDLATSWLSSMRAAIKRVYFC